MFSIGLFSPAKHALSRSLMATHTGLSTTHTDDPAQRVNHPSGSEPDEAPTLAHRVKRRAARRNLTNYFMVGVTWGATRR